MKKNHNSTIKLLFLPLLVAFVTTLVSQVVTGNSESELLHFTMFENLMLFVLIFLGVYLFTLIITVPIDLYLLSKINSKILYFILFNIIGVAIVGCINLWVLKIDGLTSMFLIFPLFAIFSLFVEFKLKK
ncbi:pilus assembly protein PilB [Lysinibacillus mangiferihumi]|uniref:Pilus assembly protein PilB n=1 Tax=Lysinibacillus mangiferihumi TaxID=1130819 RepID=A0A4U2Y0F4_9BACI|nr:pilus assembly protein PilB [Lysinibacillus mangiferihumi]TKI53787.1 pilus assembly protein PilB [Lysinibacillus mangiferihumi]